ncbi:5772_t:CDS:2 [Paraglomus occultum]|uniref:5772_t:CDS:1 n=1 Tax=Paraglomus occultum TaxID=144539 RepID=A0A9N8VWE8_9GLOM|nr:5772_t:CDS:2 [Paraglomus occultum]
MHSARKPSPLNPKRRKIEGKSSPESSASFHPNGLINDHYTDSNFVTNFRNAFQTRTDFECSTTSARLYPTPFRTGWLPDIFSSPFAHNVKQEIVTEYYRLKSSDLFEFYQSDDLKETKKPQLQKLRDALYSDHFVSMMSNLTGIELNDTPDISAHMYFEGHYLLCHDDDIEDDGEMTGRRIAFIIYLVDEWNESDGGALELFNIDNGGNPAEVTRSILPKYNTMAFFEVTPTSFHQVAEVLSPTKARLSISGWFHGSLKTRLSLAVYRPITPKVSKITEYVNPRCLTDEFIQRARKTLRKKYFLEIQDFLKDDVYDKLLESLDRVGWSEKPIGPANIRKYYLPKSNTVDNLSVDSASLPLHSAIQSFFTSGAFAEYLYSISCWRFHSVASETRRFYRNNYTVIHDNGWDREGLDVVFSCIRGVWNELWEGSTIYIDTEVEPDEEGTEKIYEMWPEQNVLTLVLRPKMTHRFVKHLKCEDGK